eukprot:1063414-Rhodomonas_salina.1
MSSKTSNSPLAPRPAPISCSPSDAFRVFHPPRGKTRLACMTRIRQPRFPIKRGLSSRVSHWAAAREHHHHRHRH